MKRLIVVTLLVSLVAGCAGNPAPVTIPDSAKPAVDTFVAVGRGLARVGIAAEMRKAGAPDAVVNATLDTLHKAVDDLLAGKKITDIVADPAAWANFRGLAVKELASYVVTAVPALDQATAELLIGGALDVAEAYVKERLTTTTATHAP